MQNGLLEESDLEVGNIIKIITNKERNRGIYWKILFVDRTQNPITFMICYNKDYQNRNLNLPIEEEIFDSNPETYNLNFFNNIYSYYGRYELSVIEARAKKEDFVKHDRFSKIME